MEIREKLLAVKTEYERMKYVVGDNLYKRVEENNRVRHDKLVVVVVHECSYTVRHLKTESLHVFDDEWLKTNGYKKGTPDIMPDQTLVKAFPRDGSDAFVGQESHFSTCLNADEHRKK